MKKQILNIGKVLSRAEQKGIFGGEDPTNEGASGKCLVTCNSGSTYRIPNCDAAPDGACHSTGWTVCSCWLW